MFSVCLILVRELIQAFKQRAERGWGCLECQTVSACWESFVQTAFLGQAHLMACITVEWRVCVCFCLHVFICVCVTVLVFAVSLSSGRAAAIQLKIKTNPTRLISSLCTQIFLRHLKPEGRRVWVSDMRLVSLHMVPLHVLYSHAHWTGRIRTAVQTYSVTVFPNAEIQLVQQWLEIIFLNTANYRI